MVANDCCPDPMCSNNAAQITSSISLSGKVLANYKNKNKKNTLQNYCCKGPRKKEILWSASPSEQPCGNRPGRIKKF